ncbi:Gmad2 immunoglobulin-like domain-containing protein [Kineococcus sp. SYSU DK004]|uniref:Gmad2 immunoglobulin-like domain-containing protein n=1 Tax=Kineococcus sp. SYSU DK004 TaxID=3383125 RepID=UPI003D7D10B2
MTEHPSTPRPPRAGAALALVTVLVTACGTGPAGPPAPGTSPPPPPPSSSTATAGPSAPPELVTVPAYYAGRTGMSGGLEVALYREFARVPLDGDRVATALRVALSPPRDPDYLVPWPEGTRLLGVERLEDLVTVDLSAEAATPPPDADAALAQAALQQVVHTVTAADPSVAGVQLLVDGSRVPDLWDLGAHAGEALARASAAEVLGPVWVLQPEEGARVTSPVTVAGRATVFEGTVGWDVVDAGGRVVAQGWTTASAAGPGRGDFSVVVDLPPGEHTVRAFSESARDGSRVAEDSKAVTVTG